MTDHRVTDLFYGHLGELKYDTNENLWLWSRDLFSVQAEILQSFDQYADSSIRQVSDKSKKPSRIARENLKWITKCHPEFFPAHIVNAALGATPPLSEFVPSYRVGCLLAIGHAVDHDGVSGSRKPLIVAMPCGETGHILKLIRPRFQTLGWGSQSAAQLRLMGGDSLDQGHWVGTGGRILQITSAEDVNGTSAWIAVRQSTVITVFRPLCGKVYDSKRLSTTPSDVVSVTGINPNPVVVLTSDMSGSQHYVDISFNPWYSRQFAVVDELGSWIIWDIQGSHNRISTLNLVRGSSGNISDGSTKDTSSKSATPPYRDSWHRIMWCSNVTTIVVCDRRSLAVFDVKAKSRPLSRCNIVAKTASDVILDMKRSRLSLNHLFVLTTSRVFWIEVTPPGEETTGQVGIHGANVILSYRHYRDGNDETLSLTPVNDQRVSLILSSLKSPVLDKYCFSNGTGNTSMPTASQSSLSTPPVVSQDGQIGSLQTLLLVPVPLKSRSRGELLGPGLRYVQQDIRFYQMLFLTADLRLLSTLCAVGNDNHPNARSSPNKILTPRTILSRRGDYTTSRYVMEDPFIVPDNLDDDGALYRVYCAPSESGWRGASAISKYSDGLRLRLDWSHVFQRIFSPDSKAGPGNTHTDQPLDHMAKMKRNFMASRTSDNNFGVRTLYELVEGFELTVDLDQVTPTLKAFMESIQQDPDSIHPPMIVSNIENGLLSYPDRTADILEVYDQLVSVWISSLPLEVSGLTRLSKFKCIRKLAIDVQLSSVVVRSGNPLPAPDTKQNEFLPGLGVKDIISQDSTPAFYSVPKMSHRYEANFSLLTPARTPSVYSSGSMALAEDQLEDPAISRLRGYTISIASQPAGRTSRLLAHWPSTPGTDPSGYSWEAAKKASAAIDDGDFYGHKARDEGARRRKRAERYLNREKTADTEASTTSGIMQTGSQPNMAHHLLSSQIMEEQPMTQPDRGVFGSRTAPQTTKKKRQQQRRAAGF